MALRNANISTTPPPHWCSCSNDLTSELELSQSSGGPHLFSNLPHPARHTCTHMTWLQLCASSGASVSAISRTRRPAVSNRCDLSSTPVILSMNCCCRFGEPPCPRSSNRRKAALELSAATELASAACCIFRFLSSSSPATCQRILTARTARTNKVFYYPRKVHKSNLPREIMQDNHKNLVNTTHLLLVNFFGHAHRGVAAFVHIAQEQRERICLT